MKSDRQKKVKSTKSPGARNKNTSKSNTKQKSFITDPNSEIEEDEEQKE